MYEVKSLNKEDTGGYKSIFEVTLVSPSKSLQISENLNNLLSQIKVMPGYICNMTEIKMIVGSDSRFSGQSSALVEINCLTKEKVLKTDNIFSF